MVEAFLGVHEIDFLIDISISVIAGVLIGVERESRGKPAGISTHSFVIGGSMIFTYLSALVDPNSTSRIAAQLVTGIGFLGAASIWFSAAIGMAIGFNYYLVAIVSIAFAVLVPRIPSLKKKSRSSDTL